MHRKSTLALLVIFSFLTTQLSLAQSVKPLQPSVEVMLAQKQDTESGQDKSSPTQNIRDPQPGEAGSCPRGSSPTAQSLSTQSAPSCPSSPFAPPKPNDTTFVVDCGPGLDTFCTFRDEGPLVFNIPVTRHVGDVQKLKANGLISETATLQMPAFDVDFFGGGGFFNPERDSVSFNGNVVPTEFLQGDDGVWRLNEFSVPIEWVNFPADPGPFGTIVPADNTVQIDIDTANSDFVWCTAIDWAALTFRVARPVVMAHGILSDGGSWNKPSFSWVNKLNSLGIPNSYRLNMGNLDSIQNNASKIAGEVAISTRRWGVDKVDLVCHSKGGIDARHYVENHDTVERVIQIGTPNGGTRLADVGQGIAVYFGGIPALIISAFAGPAGVQLTRPYMGIYNRTHGPNAKVRYTALAGDYDPDCFFLNPFCRPLDRLLLLISGKPGDTIVPVSSVHALNYTENRRFRSSGGNGEAKHTQLNGSSGVYDGVRDRVEVFGTNALALAEEEVTPSVVRTAAAAATIRQGEVQLQTIPIDQATPIFFSMMYPSGNLDLALISPSGQRFDATTVIGRTDVSHDEGDIEGGRLEVYNFSAPETGMWTVEVSAPSVTEPSGQVGYAVSGWLENPAITFAGAVERPNIHSGETLRFFGTVNNGGAPLTGASVIARVALPDNTLRDVFLRDDGADGDTIANNGVYTGALSDTTQNGTYRIAFNASRNTAPAFSREDFTIATVSRSASTISGPFQDFGLDTDDDGLFNQLVVQVGVNATVAGNYRVLGVLTDSAGNTHNASVLMSLNAGQQTVPLRFDGESIFKNRVDGPYRLTSVMLAEEGDLDMPVDERVDVHQTAGYSFGQFQHFAINLTGNGSTTGIDNDSNGLFNLLRVGIEVEIINPGFYRWSARLADRNGTELGFAAGSGFFNSGLNIMNFTFAGEPIGRNGLDGPYFVRGLILFGAGDSLVASDAFTTSALRASQFEGFSANADLSVTQIASPNPVLTGSNVTYTTTVTNLGPGTAESLTVTDDLPAETTFVSCDATGGAVCGGLGNARFVTINSLAAGASITITLVAAVECSLADGTTVSNTATVNSSTPDLNLDNNSTTASVLASNPPPVISGAAVDRPVLWPPNHQMVDVTVSYDVTDNCGATTTGLTVTSNEPVDGKGDGNTSPDWEIVDEHHVRLRAERSGNGNGRIYTIIITATDSAGGSSNQTVTVIVPHNQSGSMGKETSL
jgi:uncharacterized repeat protein (TIGR01451 family)